MIEPIEIPVDHMLDVMADLWQSTDSALEKELINIVVIKAIENFAERIPETERRNAFIAKMKGMWGVHESD